MLDLMIHRATTRLQRVKVPTHTFLVMSKPMDILAAPYPFPI
jgi:hypothetical protein